MPDEPNAIAPALSENVRIDVRDGQPTLSRWAAEDFDLRSHFTIPRTELPKLMALANAALPDDDPRKITREDVTLLLEHAASLLDDDDRPQVFTSESVRALAAKLAALLPPEG